MKIVAMLVVAIIAGTFLAADILRRPQYTPDGFVYARMAALDAGYTDATGARLVRATYEKTPLMHGPHRAAVIEMPQSRFDAYRRVFANRVLYSWLSALLLPRFGVRALFIVSAAAYVAFGASLLWLLLGVGRPLPAAALTSVALALPLTRSLAASDLTDMLAVAWWTLALAALIRSMKRSTSGLILLLAAASALLALTRPAPYIVLAPALMVGLICGNWWPFASSWAGAVAYVLDALFAHGYGIQQQLTWEWEYSHRRYASTGSFGIWYAASLLRALRYTIVETVRAVIPFVAILVGLYGIVRNWARDEVLVLFAAMFACVIAIPFNPIDSSIERVVVFPLIPVFCALLQAVVSVPLERALNMVYSPKL